MNKDAFKQESKASQAYEMIHQAKEFAAKPDDLTANPKTHTVEE